MAADRDERSPTERGRVLPEEEAVRPTPAEQRPDVDAMGLEKHRQVVGGSYGPSVAKQVGVYGAFLAVAAIAVVGFLLAARELDQPPEHRTGTAPWAQPGVEQVEPRPLDFPPSGPTDVE